jgi:hypothetical protein
LLVANLADVIVEDSSNEGAGNSEAARKALTEAVTASTEQTTAVQGETTTGTSQPADDLPPKFRGKSPKEIVEMYQNLESRTGSMANELGVQRQLTDRLLGLKREDDLRANGSRQEKPKAAPVTTNDLLDRPQETLDRVVTDRVQAVSDELRQENRQLRAQMAQQRFESRHSDFRQTVSDPAFIQWVQSSPLRMRAAAVANGGDWDVADELFTEYKSNTRAATTSTTATTADTRKPTENLEEARRASYTSSGSNSNDGQGKPVGKIYKRSDLMRLMMEDPEAYYDEAFQDEIIRAHAEKRVR